MIEQLDKWHKTRIGFVVFALVELALAYSFVSLAIDRGNFLWYLLALIFFVGFLQNFFKLLGTFYGKRRNARR
jgi:hypothetical protein